MARRGDGKQRSGSPRRTWHGANREGEILDAHRKSGWRRRLSGFPRGRTEWVATLLVGIFGGLCLGLALLIWSPQSEGDPRTAGNSASPKPAQKWVAADMDTGLPAPVPNEKTIAGRAEPAIASQGSPRFSLCHVGGGGNCVVDGDTIWMDGVKIRIADIDAPETHPARCATEAELGNRATLRLQQLLNAGPVALEAVGRDADRFGRKLRVLVREGASLGDILVSEGLARPYQVAPRQGWCD